MKHIGFLLLLAVLLATGSPSAGAAGFTVVVHQDVAGTRISREVLAGIYQGDVVRWGDETRIRPVDQSSQTAVRREFIEQVLGQSLGEVQSHWSLRMSTQRQVPPPTKASDEEVLAYVASKKGAIGYVSDGVALTPEVKVVQIVD